MTRDDLVELICAMLADRCQKVIIHPPTTYSQVITIIDSDGNITSSIEVRDVKKVLKDD